MEINYVDRATDGRYAELDPERALAYVGKQEDGKRLRNFINSTYVGGLDPRAAADYLTTNARIWW